MVSSILQKNRTNLLSRLSDLYSHMMTPLYDFIFQIHDLPKPSYFHQSIFDLGIGSYEDIEVARYDTPIIEALNKFVKKRVSALPIVDEEGKLLDIYAKFDVIVRTKN